ncbi:Ig-like domain-containing protein [Nanoarchaeota archaeon]
MKRGAILGILIILLSAFSVYADAPTVALGPLDFYEANEIDFELNVSNWHGDYEIKELRLDLSPIEVQQLVDYLGWTENLDNSLATWSEGSLANNLHLSTFELLASSPRLDEDQEFETTLTLIDNDDQEHDFTFPVIIRNDLTPPELSQLNPEDGDQVKEGDNAYPISILPVDPETGIDNATFNYILCNFEGNLTPQQHDLLLEQNEDLYENNADLSEYEDMDELCFEFSVYNRGGDESTYEGTLFVDGAPPEVFLVAPDNGALVGMDDAFVFRAEDNLADNMDCEMLIDDQVSVDNITAPNMDDVQIPSADVEEGQHTWSVQCTDLVGWQGSSDTRDYILDKTPPSIEMTTPENGSIIADSVVLEFSVSDNYLLESVEYTHDGNTVNASESFSIDVTEWPDGPNEMTVVAEDFVGNRAELTFEVTIDRTAPDVELLSPENNSTNDVHVNFNFEAIDNYDDVLDCTLYLDGLEDDSAPGVDSFTKLLPVGDYVWKVQCVDDAGNIGESEVWAVEVIDITGPDITMNNPDVVFRGDNIDISFDAYDISGVESVTATLTDPDDSLQTITLENDQDTYTASVETTMNDTLGVFVLEVQAVDTLNNSNSGEDEILLTYKYVIDLSVPSSVTPSATVTASGTVVMDDGSAVPETGALMLIPTNANSTEVQITLTDGVFSHQFAAPSTIGSYDVLFSILSEENGQTYTESATFAVAQPKKKGGGGGGGGGGLNRDRDDIDTAGCNTEWRCTAWTTCDDSEQERTCVDVNDCSNEDSNRKESRSCTMPVEEEYEQDEHDSGNTIIETPREDEPIEEYAVDEVKEDAGDSVSVGKASGFLGLGSVGLVSIFLVLLLLAVLLTTLMRMGWGRKKKLSPVQSGSDQFGLEDYLERRNK